MPTFSLYVDINRTVIYKVNAILESTAVSFA